MCSSSYETQSAFFLSINQDLHHIQHHLRQLWCGSFSVEAIMMKTEFQNCWEIREHFHYWTDLFGIVTRRTDARLDLSAFLSRDVLVTWMTIRIGILSDFHQWSHWWWFPNQCQLTHFDRCFQVSTIRSWRLLCNRLWMLRIGKKKNHLCKILKTPIQSFIEKLKSSFFLSA